MSVSSSSTFRTKLCPHFGECGGCRMQDIPYEGQLERKEGVLKRLFAAHWKEPIPVAASPSIWHYRNKVELNISLKHYADAPPEGFRRETVLGFKKTGAWYWTIDIDECRLVSPELSKLLHSVRAWFRRLGLRGYTTKGGGGGFLRNLIVREGKRTGERMVVLVTNAAELDKESFVKAVKGSYPASSILWGINTGLADQAVPERIETLYGSKTIEEELAIPGLGEADRFRFRISPFSFFQTNTMATEKLYGKVRDWVQEAAPATLYDLYGGMGGIAFSCSDLVDKVVSVESWEEASKDGRYNAEINGIKNVAFIPEKVESWLGGLVHGLRGQRGPDGLPRPGRSAAGGLGEGAAVVVDPPRAGLVPKALRRLVELRPERILYISCKPSVLAGEMEAFAPHYKLESMEAVDLFPHTEHVEAIAAFRLK